jgi:replicative DNA helicase
MAAQEDRILTKILKDGTMAEALRVGLTKDHFKDPERRQIWSFLHSHYHHPNTYKTLPPVSAVCRRWPSFELTAVDPDDDGELKALINEQKIMSFETDTRSLANMFQELVDVDPKEAVSTMQSGLTRLKMLLEGRYEHLGVSDIARRAKEHYLKARNGELFGLSWPWDCLTEDTMGKRPEDLIILYGRMKSMKTWVMLYCAAHDYLVNKARILIWSREMSQEAMAVRMASLMAKVDYQLFKKGQLPTRLEKKMFYYLDELAVRDPCITEDDVKKKATGGQDIMLLCGRNAPRNLDDLSTFISEYGPDVVYLDSFYHLESRRGEKVNQRWVKQTILVEDIKTLAVDQCIPIVAVTQANRMGEKTRGETLADITDTDATGREADLVIRVIKKKGRELHEDDYERDEEPEKAHKPKVKAKHSNIPSVRRKKKAQIPAKAQTKKKEDERRVRVGAELALVLGGNRDGILEAFTIHAIPGYNFSLIDTNYTTDDVRRWAEEEIPKGAAKPNYNFGNLGYGKQ